MLSKHSGEHLQQAVYVFSVGVTICRSNERSIQAPQGKVESAGDRYAVQIDRARCGGVGAGLDDPTPPRSARCHGGTAREAAVGAGPREAAPCPWVPLAAPKRRLRSLPRALITGAKGRAPPLLLPGGGSKRTPRWNPAPPQHSGAPAGARNGTVQSVQANKSPPSPLVCTWCFSP